MKRYESLIEALPPRNLPDGVEAQVGDISPYRKLVTCTSDGLYETAPVSDDSPLHFPSAPDYIVSITRFLTGTYPSDTAEMFALALFGLFPELRGSTCLCIDGNEVSAPTLAAALSSTGVRLLYTDDAELAQLVSPIAEPDSMRMTYRRQVIWNGEVPGDWVERLGQEELFRKYNQMLSRTRHALNDAITDSRRRYYYMPESKKYDASQLSQLVDTLGCGYMESDFALDAHPPELSPSSPIEDFTEHNVSFSRIEEILSRTEINSPDIGMLKDIATVWREVVFKENPPERADLLALPLDELSSEHAMDTYIDALANGVPVADLLA